MSFAFARYSKVSVFSSRFALKVSSDFSETVITPFADPVNSGAIFPAPFSFMPIGRPISFSASEILFYLAESVKTELGVKHQTTRYHQDRSSSRRSEV